MDINGAEARRQVYCLITLGLWEQAQIYCSHHLTNFTVERDEYDKIVVRWYDHYYSDRPHRAYWFDQLRESWSSGR